MAHAERREAVRAGWQVVPGEAPDAWMRSGEVSRTEERELLRLVASHMRRIAGPHPDFDDLVQLGMIGTLGALADFRGDSSLSTYVAGICYRVWYKHLRSLRRRLARLVPSLTGALPESTDASAEAPRLPSDQILSHERWRRLYAALDQLGEKRRTAVVLHDLDELEIEEIACIVGAPPATVRTRLRDGRRGLRELLQHDPYFTEENTR